jgi:hypothetical protein
VTTTPDVVFAFIEAVMFLLPQEQLYALLVIELLIAVL